MTETQPRAAAPGRRRGISAWWIVGLLAATLNACSVTVKQPQIVPVNPVRTYSVGVEEVCDAALRVLAEMTLPVASETPEATGCSIATEYKDISNRGDRLDHLREVAIIGNQGSFSHGRFLLTVTVKETSPSSTSVRVSSRIEGYEASYQMLRTSGLIEATVFTKLDADLATIGVR